MKRALIGVLVAGCMAVVSANAGAMIVPQRGMLGVRLGMTENQVLDRLGDPGDSREVRGRFGTTDEWRYGTG